MVELIKICGLSTMDAISAAADAGADMVGLVHFRKSPRHLTVEQIDDLIDATRAKYPTLKTTIVVVNPDDALLAMLAHQAHPDFIQLHGKETPARVKQIQNDYPTLGIIKALSVATSDDLQALPDYANLADHILLDTKAPKDANLPGGNGIPFDWSILQGAKLPESWILSGGLSPDNVVEASRVSGAKAFDVSSGVESAPGVKDYAKIAAFIKALRK